MRLFIAFVFAFLVLQALVIPEAESKGMKIIIAKQKHKCCECHHEVHHDDHGYGHMDWGHDMHGGFGGFRRRR
jgi:cytochrome c peroxidase